MTDIEAIKKSRDRYLFDLCRTGTKEIYSAFRCQRCGAKFTILESSANSCPTCSSKRLTPVEQERSLLFPVERCDDDEYINENFYSMRRVFKAVERVLSRYNLPPVETICTPHEAEKPGHYTENEEVWVVPTQENVLVGVHLNTYDKNIVKVYRIKDPSLWQDDSDLITEPIIDEEWTETKIAKGVVRRTSAAHPIGFFHLSEAKNKRISKEWRSPDGWYEESKSWMVIVTFPQLFSEEDIIAAKDILMAHKKEIEDSHKLAKVHRV